MGAVLAGLSALSYAATVVLGRDLAKAGVSSATALGFRFGVAAPVIAVVLVALRKPLLPPPGERLRLAVLGGVVYSLQATLFFLALGHATAAAAALVFYAYPAMVVGLEAALGTPLPWRRVVPAVALAAAGTVVVVAAGERVTITPAGVAYALGAAAVVAVYFIAGNRYVTRTDPWTVAGWVAGGGALSTIGFGLVTGSLTPGGGGHLPQLVAYGALTALAFGFMFGALARLGPARTAVVMTLEAFFAVVLGAAFLHESLSPVQAVGGAAILAAAATAAAAAATAATATRTPGPPAGPPGPAPR